MGKIKTIGTKQVMTRVNNWVELDDCFAFIGWPYTTSNYFFVKKDYHKDEKLLPRYIGNIFLDYQAVTGYSRHMDFLNKLSWFRGKDKVDFKTICFYYEQRLKYEKKFIKKETI